MLSVARQTRALASGVAGAGTAGLLRAVFGLARGLGPNRASDLGGFLARSLGPLVPQHRIALANVRAAFPDKSEAEVAAIVRGAWDNLGRTGAEYAHLEALLDYDPGRPDAARTEWVGLEHLAALRDDGKPGLVFAAHLANWEIAAIAAAKLGFDVTAVFRPPNNEAVGRMVHDARRATMGNLTASGRGAIFAMKRVIEGGGHLGMLLDQHFTRGVVVDFLGRPALANPVMAQFARRYDCPVHGCRAVRLADHRFRIELTGPLDLPRDAEGRIDIHGATQAISDVIAGWIREHPEQWLWMHRRWRVPVAPERSGTALKAT